MPSELRVVDQKFFAKLNNGDDFSLNPSDFSRHLKGGVLEEIKAVFNVQIEWYVYLSSYNTLYDSAAQTLRIEKSGLDFGVDGFSVGDTVKLSQADIGVEGEVSSLKVGEIILINVSITRGSLSDGYFINTTGPDPLVGISEQTALSYKFGLIENIEPFNTLSKLTNTNQTYLFKNIDHLTPLTFVDGESFGNNKAWVTGSAKVAFVGLSPDKDYNDNQDTTQEFQIEHVFKINPVYRDGDEDSLDGTDVPPLDLFNGDLSLKYVFESEFRTTLNNPNTSKAAIYDTQKGSVGYLGESYNGFKNNYNVEGLQYVINGNGANEIEVGSITNVSFTIKSDNGSFTPSTPIVVGHTAIVNSLSYSNNTNTYQNTWTDEALRNVTGLAAVSGVLIKNYTATYIDVNTIDVSYDIEFTPFQNSILENGQRYLLYYTIQDPSLTVETGDKVTNRVEVNFYNKNTDIEGLFEVEKFEQYPHPESFEEGVSEGFTNALTFNESGMMLYSLFWVDNTAILENLSFELVVYNSVTSKSSVLRSFLFDLSDQVIVNGTQQIEIDSTRGYILKEDDIFNFVKISTKNNDGVKQYYSLQVGYKIPWQTWLEFPDAPTVFYDTSKPFNGLNQKASNYSLKGTGVNIFTNGDNGTFENQLPLTWNIDALPYSVGTPDQLGDSFGSESGGRGSDFGASLSFSSPTLVETSKDYKCIETTVATPTEIGGVYEVYIYTALEENNFDPNLLDNAYFILKVDGQEDEDLYIDGYEVTSNNTYPSSGNRIWFKISTVFTAKNTSENFTLYLRIKEDLALGTSGLIFFDDWKVKEVEYSIRASLNGVLSQNGIDTTYIELSESIDVFDYNEDDKTPTRFTCEINTYNDKGVVLQNNIIEEKFTELRAVFTPLIPPSFSESVNFTEVANDWNRFAHGNELLPPATATPRTGDWANEQADDDDIFNETGAPGMFTKNSAGLYTSAPTSIETNQNCNAFYGCYSVDLFEFYSISGSMFSDASDNDALIYTIAFTTDELGVEHTLSLCATTGGVLLDINPLFVLGNNQTSTIAFPAGDPASWALVYDMGKRDATQLFTFPSSQVGFDWGDVQVGDLAFNVQRSAEEIIINVDWTVNGEVLPSTLSYNLNNDPLTVKFLGAKNIGFGFLSQDQGGFKDVILTMPEADFYGILRMEKENAPSDSSINELSTIIEAPEGNLLTNLFGTEKKAILSFDSTSFIVQGKIDTSLIEEGENYKFSAELRPLDLEKKDLVTGYDLILQQAQIQGESLPDQPTQDLQRTLYNGLFDELAPWTLETCVILTRTNDGFSLIDWADPINNKYIKVNNPTYSSVNGFSFDGVSQHLSSNNFETLLSDNSKASTYGFGWRILNELMDANFRSVFGSVSAGGASDMFFRKNSNNTYYNHVYTTKNNIVYTPTNNINSYVGGQTTSSSWFENTTLIDTNVVAPSSTNASNSVLLGASTDGVTPIQFGQFDIKHFIGGVGVVDNIAQIDVLLNNYHNA